MNRLEVILDSIFSWLYSILILSPFLYHVLMVTNHLVLCMSVVSHFSLSDVCFILLVNGLNKKLKRCQFFQRSFIAPEHTFM